MASSKREETAKGIEGLTGSAIRQNIRLAYLAIALIVIAAILYTYVNLPKNGYQSCSSILYSSQKINCLKTLAESSGNYTPCSYIPNMGPKYQCIQALAEKRLDLSGCMMLNSTASYSYFVDCIYNITGVMKSAAGCNALNGIYQPYCAIRVAAETGFTNPGDCNDTTNSVVAGSCLSVYYYNKASTTGDPSYCKMVNDQSGLGLQEALLYLSNDSVLGGYSTTYTQNLTLNGYCYAAAAYTSANVAICDNLSGTEGEICSAAAGAKAIAVKNQNITANFSTLSKGCTYANSSTSSLCMDVIRTSDAINTKNASECGLIQTALLQNTCYGDIAYAYNDTSYCSYIANVTIRNNCVLVVGNRTTGG